MHSFTCRIRHKGHPSDDRAIRDVIEMIVLETGTPAHQYIVTFGPVSMDQISYYQDVTLSGLSAPPDPQRETVYSA